MSELLLLPPASSDAKRELAVRSGDKLKVTLWWYEASDTVAVELVDENTESNTTFSVKPDKALDAFHHPYAYAPENLAA